MMDSYDLFSAMSGIDEELITRSDFRAKRRRSQWIPILFAAACFAVLLFSAVFLFDSSEPDSLYVPPTSGMTEPAATETVPAAFNQPLQLNGSDVGTLNIVHLSHVEEATSMPEFLMYIDSENYYLADDGTNFYIYQKVRSENKPACWLTLTWEPDSTMEQALHRQSSSLSASMESVTAFESNPLLDGPMVCGSNGSAWDSAQTEVYLVSDLHNGVFVLTLQYYLDDTDGHAIRFRDMIQTFEIVTDDRMAPDWMTGLRSAVTRLSCGFFKNDFSDMQELISENAEISTYGSDVLSEALILKTHYTVDNDQNPTVAHVSVRHKYREPDAYDYITMELKYIDGKWQVEWAMLER